MISNDPRRTGTNNTPTDHANNIDNASSELTAAAALTSLVSAMGHVTPNADVRSQEVLPTNHFATDDLDFPTQFTKSGRKKAIPFPVKLMKVLASPQYESIIGWLPSGKSFKVHNSKLFTKEVLPLHFKSAKFSSFTRKLHRWGFMRNYRGQEEGAFYHDQFLRGRMDLASKMTCRSAQELSKPSAMTHQKVSQNTTHGGTSTQGSQLHPMMQTQPGMPRMPPTHIPDMQQGAPYAGQVYPQNNGFLHQGEYPGTPQRQLMRPVGSRMSMPSRQPSLSNMAPRHPSLGNMAPAPSSFSPDLNVAIEMEVSRRLEEIMSVSANLEMMKEQAKMTAINRLQTYPSQPQQQPQQMQQQPQPQQQVQQQETTNPGESKPLHSSVPMTTAMPNPPDQQDQPSAIGAKTA